MRGCYKEWAGSGFNQLLSDRRFESYKELIDKSVQQSIATSFLFLSQSV